VLLTFLNGEFLALDSVCRSWSGFCFSFFENMHSDLMFNRHSGVPVTVINMSVCKYRALLLQPMKRFPILDWSVLSVATTE